MIRKALSQEYPSATLYNLILLIKDLFPLRRWPAVSAPVWQRHRDPGFDCDVHGTMGRG
jgi:hypothetical protein